MQFHSSSEVILARKQLTIIEQAYQDKDCDTDILSASIEELMNIYHKSKAAKFELEETLEKLRVGFETVQAALDRKSTRLNSSHSQQSRMPSSA